MKKKLLVPLIIIFLGCSLANAGQEMPQQMWWDIYQSYQYVISGPKTQMEQRREKWSNMNDAQRDAATPQSVRLKWLNMSMGERQQASQTAWSFMQSLH